LLEAEWPLAEANAFNYSEDVEIAKETIKYYWYELITHGIKCNEKRCERKKISLGDKTLSLPYEVTNKGHLKRSQGLLGFSQAFPELSPALLEAS
jgi:hypothetical protein